MLLPSTQMPTPTLLSDRSHHRPCDPLQNRLVIDCWNAVFLVLSMATTEYDARPRFPALVSTQPSWTLYHCDIGAVLGDDYWIVVDRFVAWGKEMDQQVGRRRSRVEEWCLNKAFRLMRVWGSRLVLWGESMLMSYLDLFRAGSIHIIMLFHSFAQKPTLVFRAPGSW